MGRKGENKRTKRAMAPSFWTIQRKSHQFTVSTSPGPHGREDSYPLAVLIREVLKVVNTYQEARDVIRDGKILVDGVVRRVPDFPVGLMDILEIPILKKVYRMVPVKGSALGPVEIPDSEKNLKLCKVRSKTSVRGGRVQYGFHDGRSILAESEIDMGPSDVCLLEVPSQKIVRVVGLKKGVIALAVKGRRAGKIGRVKELRSGTMIRSKMADLDIEGVEAELPADMIIAVGDEKPLVTVTGGE